MQKKYNTGDLTAKIEGEVIHLHMTENEFNFLREALRELRRVVEPWELSALTGWEGEDVDRLMKDMWEFAESNGIHM